MGRDKLALPYAGHTILWHAVDSLCSSVVSKILIITAPGCEYDLPVDPRVQVVVNPKHREGLGTSLSLAASRLAPADESLLVTLGDKPLLRSKTVDDAVKRFAESRPALLVCCFRGAPGHPVIFSPPIVRELLSIGGDEGARRIVRSHRDAERFDTDDEGVVFDIDTDEDYTNLLSRD